MLIVIIGGASSGKSAVAESIADQLPAPVTYVATLVPDPDDADLARRIATHQVRRPASWTTLEATSELPDQLRGVEGTVLIDSLGPWVALHGADDASINDLLDAIRVRGDDTVIVSEEVGMSVHPESEAGRAFQDSVGKVNQRLAERADHTLLVVAGRVVTTALIDISAITHGR